MRIDQIYSHEPRLTLGFQFARSGPQPRRSRRCRKVIKPVPANRTVNQVAKPHEIQETVLLDHVTVFEQWRVDRHVRCVESTAEVPLSLIGGMITQFCRRRPIVTIAVDISGCQGAFMLSKTPVCWMC